MFETNRNYPRVRVALKNCEDVISGCVDEMQRNITKQKDDALLEELAKRHIFDLVESKLHERIELVIQGCEETFYLDGKPILTFGAIQQSMDFNNNTQQNIFRSTIPIVRYTL